MSELEKPVSFSNVCVRNAPFVLSQLVICCVSVLLPLSPIAGKGVLWWICGAENRSLNSFSRRSNFSNASASASLTLPRMGIFALSMTMLWAWSSSAWSIFNVLNVTRLSDAKRVLLSFKLSSFFEIQNPILVAWIWRQGFHKRLLITDSPRWLLATAGKLNQQS